MPVLLSEVIENLRVLPGKKYIDVTLGGGGHSLGIIKRGGLVLGLDRDMDAIDYVRKYFLCIPNIRNNLKLEQGNFNNLAKIAVKNGFGKVAGILFDLGLSTHQLIGSGRGFTYKNDEPLDMRMDIESKLNAFDILNTYSKEELYEIFIKFSEELNSRAIAGAIVRSRSLSQPIRTTADLIAIIETQLRQSLETERIGVLKQERNKILARIFQALRIKVNNELDNLKSALPQAINLLIPEGRLAVISYHSLEDRIVKMIFQTAQKESSGKIITNKPILAERFEIDQNPKSNCAKLRVLEKV